MPRVRAARFVRYAGGPDLTALVCPPYDVIDEAGRAALEANSPHNFVRLILPREEPGEEPVARYRRARALLDGWTTEGVLVQDDAPTLLAVEQEFIDPVSGARCVRRGVQALLALTPFEAGEVRPHERTLSGPKADRLALVEAVGAQLSPIFVLYPDPANEVLASIADVFSTPPDVVAEAAGATHRAWRIADPARIARVTDALAKRPGYIADGHHRYETALAYQRLQPAADAIPAFFCSLSDPGLIVLPTHRLLSGTGATFDGLRAKLSAFSQSPLPSAADVDALVDAVRAAGPGAFAMVAPDGRAVLLRWTRESLAGVLPTTPLGELDVTALHTAVFEKTLGLSPESQARQENLRYVKDARDAIRRTLVGEAELGFLLNATPSDQVRRVADAGEVMPQKSTFFFPKIIDGLGLVRFG